MDETSIISVDSSHAISNAPQTYCFLITCKNRGQSLPVEFQILLAQHDDNTITFRHALHRWNISVRNNYFEEGWIEFYQDNIIKQHDMLLLRHGGYLIFDIIHFCELKKQVYLRWTVSLPDLFHQQSSIDPAFLSLHRQTVSSSLSPNFYQDLSNSICFYQPFDSAYPNSLKLPRFVHHFLNAERTPTIVLKTGHNITEVGIKANRLKRNWRKFVLDHHLQHNDTLVFIPESQANFAVLIFDSNGVERFFLGTIFSRCIFMVDEYPLTYLMLNQMYN